MRGGRTAGQEHAGPRTQVIRHAAAVLLGRGDGVKTERRARGERGASEGPGNPRVARFDIRRRGANRLTRLIKGTSHPACLRRSLP
ncbi:hypothetical protein EYF80_054795 [Liparis tanakae]|uniref:Uncharacterized protein n=1 Tax=Liparis tanakae TaxID=230148 RepID=A0A4Z2F1W8_9TELE|nr:hypothetical protein EYF80_054795 [Liparis tanakae]